MARRPAPAKKPAAAEQVSTPRRVKKKSEPEVSIPPDVYGKEVVPVSALLPKSNSRKKAAEDDSYLKPLEVDVEKMREELEHEYSYLPPEHRKEAVRAALTGTVPRYNVSGRKISSLAGLLSGPNEVYLVAKWNEMVLSSGKLEAMQVLESLLDPKLPIPVVVDTAKFLVNVQIRAAAARSQGDKDEEARRSAQALRTMYEATR